MFNSKTVLYTKQLIILIVLVFVFTGVNIKHFVIIIMESPMFHMEQILYIQKFFNISKI